MKKMNLLGGVFVSILLMTLLSSCGESTPLPTATPTQVPTPVPTATPVPTPVPTATPVPFPGLSEWDLLFISDSSNIGVGDIYARLIEADQHVKVNLHDCWRGNLQAFSELQMLQNNSLPCDPNKSWADLVREAEVIVVFGGPALSVPTDGSWSGNTSWVSCVAGGARAKGLDAAAAATYKADIVKSCNPDTFALYRTHLGALFDKIFELRAGSPVIMRATDSYITLFSTWQAAGVEDCCSTCFEAFSSAIHQVAAEHKVPVGSSMTALNGQNHQADPTELGYIGPDGHLSNLGAQRVAQALQQTGYAYAGR